MSRYRIVPGRSCGRENPVFLVYKGRTLVGFRSTQEKASTYVKELEEKTK